MKILYLGDDNKYTTSGHRAEALRRLGHEVTHLNCRAALPKGRLMGGLSVRLGYRPFSLFALRYLKRQLGEQQFDLAWIDGGAELGSRAYKWLHGRGLQIINYNVDDPFGARDGRKWDLYKESLPLHDLTAVVRVENVAEAQALGASKVCRVFRSYDPVAHAPVEPTEEERNQWSSAVSFVGSWMPERGPFMVRLIELGVPLTIRGNRWEKAPEWAQLKKVWAGPGVLGRDYVLALQCSRVALGLLSIGNRDLHTQRSSEVPFIGGAAFCAERTCEHQEMLEEGSEAEFWSSPEECARKCLQLLEDEASRLRMVQSARERVCNSNLSNDAVLKEIISKL